MTIETINDGESGASVLGKLNGNFAELLNGRDTLNWWAGRTEITILSVGDSNSAGSGGVDPGVIPDDDTIRLYVNPTGAVPYSTAGHEWGYHHPDSALRSSEYASAITLGYTTYTGQLMGGNGNPGWAMANRFSASTDVLKYVFQTAKGGTRMDFWASGDGWDSLEAEVPVALAAIPGSPTAFDIILMSFGGNDMIQGRTAEQIADDFDTFRTNAKAEGWWGPNTQVIIMECPDNGSVTGYTDGAMCYEYILNRSDERVGFVPSVGLEYDAGFPVHFLPASYVKLGVAAADLALSSPVRHKGAVRDNTYVQKLAPVLGGDLDADGFAIITPDIESASGVTAIDISPEGNASYKLTYTIDPTTTNLGAITAGGPNGLLYESRVGAATAFPAHNFNTTNTLSSTGPIAAFSNNDTVKATVDRNGFFSGPGYNGNHYGGLVAGANFVSEAAITATAARVIEGWTANDPSNLIVPAFAAGTLTVPTGGDGTYFVTANVTSWVGSISKTYGFYLFKNTGPLGFRGISLVTAAVTGIGAGFSMSGPIALAAGDVVSLYALSSDGGTLLTIVIADLFMQRIGA